jgi:hypothetical protein
MTVEWGDHERLPGLMTRRAGSPARVEDATRLYRE